MERSGSELREWVNTSFKWVAAALCGLVIWTYQESAKATKETMAEIASNNQKALVESTSAMKQSLSELSSATKDLTSVVKAIELRVNAIEVDRSNAKDTFRVVVSDVSELKTNVAQLNAKWDITIAQINSRLQTLADFVAKIGVARAK